ncbi:P-loop NTPase fold protein [Clostridium saccharoperbutylacetonicum]|uniref:P-loop NTPase fold protein n=1 Tax=Clostridium saccharoperbutylacetonicum TaxID=36745 RepID=UPI0039EC52DC
MKNRKVRISHYSEMEIKNLEIEIIICIIILLMSFLISVCVFKLRLSKAEDQFSENLIYKRNKDLERLKDYFKEFNIVGVWGSGKSFVINELKKHIKEEYEIIENNIVKW